MNIFTTEQLIDILQKEQQACIKGERVVPYLPPNADEVAAQIGGALGKFFGAEKFSHIAHYRNIVGA